MTDYIKREDALTIARHIASCCHPTDFHVVKKINSIPSADVVEVVRCDQCRHFEAINNDDHGWCKLISDLPCEMSVRYDDDYCSYGERAEA